MSVPKRSLQILRRYQPPIFNCSRQAYTSAAGPGRACTGGPTADVAARDEALAAGITINGLVIVESGKTVLRTPHSTSVDIEDYYRTIVIGGGGAFVEVAQGYRSFGAALIRKLVKEIAFRPTLPDLAR